MDDKSAIPFLPAIQPAAEQPTETSSAAEDVKPILAPAPGPESIMGPPQGRSTRSKTRAAQHGPNPVVGSSEFDSSLTSALLSLSTPFVQGSSSASRPNYSEDSLDPEEEEPVYRYQPGDDDPMDCVKRDPSRVACVYRGEVPLTKKDFRNPAGGLFVRCKWCRARTTASSKATKARKEGMQPVFTKNFVPDPNNLPEFIGGMSTAGWEPVCSIKGCKADHPLTINDFLNSYGDRLYRMCNTCRADAARSRDRNKKRKSGQLDESDMAGPLIDVEATPVPPCSGKGCAATRALTLQDFLNPYGDALLKMCSFCRARHSSYKKAKKGDKGREAEAAEVLSHLASASEGSEASGSKGKKEKKPRAPRKSAAKAQPSAVFPPSVDQLQGAPVHDFEINPLAAHGDTSFVDLPGGASFSHDHHDGHGLPSLDAGPPPPHPHDYSQLDLSQIDPSLLPDEAPINMHEGGHASLAPGPATDQELGYGYPPPAL